MSRVGWVALLKLEKNMRGEHLQRFHMRQGSTLTFDGTCPAGGDQPVKKLHIGFCVGNLPVWGEINEP